MKAIPLILTLNVLATGAGWGQEPSNAGPWREWSILTADDDVHVQALAFAPKTMTVAAGQNNGQVRLWSAIIGRMESIFDCKPCKTVLALRFDDSGEHLLIAGDSGVQIWKVATARKVKEWQWRSKDASRAVIAADGSTVACLTEGSTVEAWSVATGRMIRSIAPGKDDDAWSALALTSDGQQIGVGTTGGQVMLWSVGEGEQAAPALLERKGTYVRGVAFSPDGSRLAVVRGREAVALIDVLGWRLQRRVSVGTPPYHVVAFSPDSKTVAAGCGNGAVEMWDAVTGDELDALKGHAGLLLAMAFAPDSHMLATASADMLVRVWDRHRHLEVPQIRLEQKELDALIKDLGSDNDIKVSRATLTLSAAVPQTVAAFKKSLRQGTPPDVKLIRKLIEDLSNEQFAVRSKATQKLAAMGEAARAELRYALAKPLDLETKRRLETLHAKLIESFQPDEQRLTQRAIVILERIGSAEAKEILAAVLYGVPDDALIAQARAALERLKK
jgi:hypothetical protein